MLLWRGSTSGTVVTPPTPAPTTICTPKMLWEIIRMFCFRTGLPTPDTIFGGAPDQVGQVLTLLEEEGTDLSKRAPWQQLTFEALHTTVANEDQGAITDIASQCFRHIKNQTIWDRTTHLPVAGPMDAQDWQAMKGLVSTGPRYRFRLRGGHLLVNPVPPAGNVWAFEYLSKHWIVDQNLVTTKQYFTSDYDLVLLPDDLLLMGLRWRWKREKGLDYAEDLRTYEMQLKDEMGWDGGRPILHMDDGSREAIPGMFISPGSWNL
jgi:hypothetical protein